MFPNHRRIKYASPRREFAEKLKPHPIDYLSHDVKSILRAKFTNSDMKVTLCGHLVVNKHGFMCQLCHETTATIIA